MLYGMCTTPGDETMKCMLCGRELKSQSSMEQGYGPVCYRKVYGNKKNKNSEKIHNADSCPVYDIPGQMTIFDFISK